MSNIVYRRADYHEANDRSEVLRLYREIFHMDMSEKYDHWFCDENRKTVGIVAVDEETGKLVGHWAYPHFEAVIAGRQVGFRHSMGLMTDAAYRGRGIAKAVFQALLQAFREEGDARFLIAFPNDVSYRIHIDPMGFVLKKDYHFITFPGGKSRVSYRRDDTACQDLPDAVPGGNHLLHSAEYMRWHYQDGAYEKWQSENGHVFIATRFMDKMDIVYWSGGATAEELSDFASFLYETRGVDRVSTWNTMASLDGYPAEERGHHMCIHYLDCTPAQREEIGGDWFYYMGDCDLY